MANPLNEYEEMHLTTLARAWIVLGRWENDVQRLHQAVQMLRALSKSAEARRRIHAGVEIDLLGALALWELASTGQGSSLEALEWLTRSLLAGMPGGYQRIYINEGKPMREMLTAWLARDRQWIAASGVDVRAVHQLLAAMGEQEPCPQPAETSTLVEPLTEREKDVLQLLALGLSNREMAEKLVLSEGTIKTHVHNLIGKLGAQSRTQVLARARELNLL